MGCSRRLALLVRAPLLYLLGSPSRQGRDEVQRRAARGAACMRKARQCCSCACCCVPALCARRAFTAAALRLFRACSASRLPRVGPAALIYFVADFICHITPPSTKGRKTRVGLRALAFYGTYLHGRWSGCYNVGLAKIQVTFNYLA